MPDREARFQRIGLKKAMRTRKAVDIFTAGTQRADKSGYEFIGWNDLPDGSGAYYEKLYDLQAGVKVTRPAQGISMGSEVEYADEETLSRAIKSRVEM